MDTAPVESVVAPVEVAVDPNSMAGSLLEENINLKKLLSAYDAENHGASV